MEAIRARRIATAGLVCASGVTFVVITNWVGPAYGVLDNLIGQFNAWLFEASLLAAVAIFAAFLLRKDRLVIAVALVVACLYLSVIIASLALYGVSISRPPLGPVEGGQGFMVDSGGFNSLEDGYLYDVVSAASLGSVPPASSGEAFPAPMVLTHDFWAIAIVALVSCGAGAVVRWRRLGMTALPAGIEQGHRADGAR